MKTTEKINTVADLLKATREFYTKRKKKWGRFNLKSENRYCVLGAMCSVLTNESRLEGAMVPHHTYKQYSLIREASKVLGSTVASDRGRSIFRRVFNWNDESNRQQVLEGLRKAEARARKEGK